MSVFSNIDGEESATVTFTVSAVSITRNSSAELQEILTIGDPDSSLALAAVTNVAPASTRWAINTRIVSGPSSLVDLAVRAVLPSTAADNPVSAAQASTVWAVQLPSSQSFQAKNSTIGDLLASVQQNSTVWAVQLTQYSTTANVSSLAGTVLVNPASSGATGFYAVRLSDGSTFVTDSTQRAIRVTSVDVGGSTQVAISSGIVQVQHISSSGVSMSTDTAPASTVQGLIVRQVGFSTTVNVSSLAGPVIVRSSAADQLMTAYQSSYANFLANVHNSTIGDLLASVQQNSTVWQVQAKIQDSSAVGFIGTTTRPTTGAQGLLTRTILNDLQSTYLSTMGNGSTSSTIVSSVAAQRVKVYAYSITSTAQAINTLSFASSLASPIWGVQMQSPSSGITGANLAVTPPAWLFATAAADPLVFKITGTTGTYHLAFSYFVEA